MSGENPNPFKPRSSLGRSPPKEKQGTAYTGEDPQMVLQDNAQAKEPPKQTKRKFSPEVLTERKKPNNLEDDQESITSDQGSGDSDLEASETEDLERVIEGQNSIERLSAVVETLIRGKKAPTNNQVLLMRDLLKQIKDYTLKAQNQLLQIKGRNREQSKVIDKLINSRFEDRLAQEFSKMTKEVNDKLSKQPPRVEAHSYANVAKSGTRPTDIPKPSSRVILVYPENKEQSSEETLHAVQKSLEPDKRVLRVNRMTKIRNGGVAIEVHPQHEESIRGKLCNSFETRKPKLNLPKVKVFDVPKDMSKEELQDSLYEKNFTGLMSKDEFNKGFKLLFKTGPRGDEQTQWVAEANRAVRDRITENGGRLYLGWRSIKIAQITLTTRCFRCQAYGHLAANCKEEKDTCGHCAKEGHRFSECPEKEWDWRCATCIRAKMPKVKHNPNSKECPIYSKEVERLNKSIDYES